MLFVSKIKGTSMIEYGDWDASILSDIFSRTKGCVIDSRATLFSILSKTSFLSLALSIEPSAWIISAPKYSTTFLKPGVSFSTTSLATWSASMTLMPSFLKIIFSTTLTSYIFYQLINFFNDNLSYDNEYKLLTIILLVIITFVITVFFKITKTGK